MWSIHTIEYYSALKWKDIPTPATTRMNLEDVMLCDISQLQKDKYCMIRLREVPGGTRFTETESRMVGARGWQWGWGVSV